MGIYVDNEKCVGCNKCIRICPVKFAYKVGDNNYIDINQQACIKCGLCIKTCEHGARYYSDDTELMLKDLEKGIGIAAVIAPSARANFNINKLIAALKSIGIKACYDVSLGADITTWAYIKYIKEKLPSSIITQPCPVIVNYIEKYENDLIKYLAPIHSPMMCLAVYLKKYLGIKDKIAFISPCIGKEDEISKYSDYIAYNVTFSKLYEAIKDKYDNAGQDGNSIFDLPEAYLGRLFSRPGGLKENILTYLEDVKVKQVEGPHVYKYLSGDYKNADDMVKPTIVDVLNCENGCNQGTGCNNARPVDDIDYQFDNMKKEITNKRRQKKLINEFDKKLNLHDFIITYTPTEIGIKYPTKNEADTLFNSMFKYTKKERTLNCNACGYHSCYDMISAIYNGMNKKENCIHYNKALIGSLYNDNLTGLYNRKYIEDEIRNIERPCHLPLSVIMSDINGLQLINNAYGNKTGDITLKKVAEILKKNCRRENITARWGEDEFIILQPLTDAKTTEEIINMIKNECILNSDDSLQISLSFGYAEKNKAEENIWDIIESAEKRMLLNKFLNNKSCKNDVILALVTAISEKSMETKEHAERLKEICKKIGEIMGLSSQQLEELKLTSILHDIGKVSIKESILLKPCPLTEEEWMEMKKHSEIGYRIIQATPGLTSIAEYILYHHERWDGNGYPRGLKGEEIPLLSRIITVADSFDAMTNNRVYRKAMSREEAIAEIKRNAGTQFEPAVVNAFIESCYKSE